MSTRQVRIETGGNSDSLRLEIKDDVSGVTLARMILEPEQIWKMLSGGSFSIEATMADRLDRVGKAMENWSVTYGSDALIAANYDQQLRFAEAKAQEQYPDWDVYDARRRGGGSGEVQVVMRRWVTPVICNCGKAFTESQFNEHMHLNNGQGGRHGRKSD